MGLKARVKATDRIIEVMCVMKIEGVAVWEEISGIGINQNQYTSDELEFLDFPEMPIATYTPDYWTRLEHQYAGMAMQGILANIDLLMSLAKKKADDYPAKYIVAEYAKDCAHALVEKMKEK